MKRHAISPTLFVIGLICFILPWLSVSCQGERVVTLSGVELITGKTIQGNDRVSSQPAAGFILLVLLIGLAGTVMLRNDFEGQRIWATICGILVLGGVFLTKFLLERQIQGEIVRHNGRGAPGPIVLVEPMFGYWLLLLATVAIGLLYIIKSPLIVAEPRLAPPSGVG
jgi:hypothetical protein